MSAAQPAAGHSDIVPAPTGVGPVVDVHAHVLLPKTWMPGAKAPSPCPSPAR
jgi:hypothetical protein